MTDDAETVAEVLDDLELGPAAIPLFNIAMGTADPSQLGYQDWWRPMQLTDGEVCLRVKHPTTRNPAFYTVEGESLRVVLPNGEASEGPGVLRLLRADIRDLPHRITPVLRSETPFAEVE